MRDQVRLDDLEDNDDEECLCDIDPEGPGCYAHYQEGETDE